MRFDDGQRVGIKDQPVEHAARLARLPGAPVGPFRADLIDAQTERARARIRAGDQYRPAEHRGHYAPPAVPMPEHHEREHEEHPVSGATLHHHADVDDGGETRERPARARHWPRGGVGIACEEKHRECHQVILRDLQLEHERIRGGALDQLDRTRRHDSGGHPVRKREHDEHRHRKRLDGERALALRPCQRQQYGNGEQESMLDERPQRIIHRSNRVAHADRGKRDHRDDSKARPAFPDGRPLCAKSGGKDPPDRDQSEENIVERGRDRERRTERDGGPPGEPIATSVDVLVCP
jgi:hypothetical protein